MISSPVTGERAARPPVFTKALLGTPRRLRMAAASFLTEGRALERSVRERIDVIISVD
jgi:hypothetical protein